MNVLYPHGGGYLLSSYVAPQGGKHIILSRTERSLRTAFDRVCSKFKGNLDVYGVFRIEVVCPPEPFIRKVHALYYEQDLKSVEYELMCKAEEVYQLLGVIPKGFLMVDYGVDSVLEVDAKKKPSLIKRAMESGLFPDVSRRGVPIRGDARRVDSVKGLRMCLAGGSGVELSKAYPTSSTPHFYYLEIAKDPTLEEDLEDILEHHCNIQRDLELKREGMIAQRIKRRKLQLVKVCDFFGVDSSPLTT